MPSKKSPAEVVQQYKAAKKRHDEIKQAVDNLNNIANRIENNLRERVKQWARFRKSIAKRTAILFNVFLSQKGYAGSIDFDHEQKTLAIAVCL